MIGGVASALAARRPSLRRITAAKAAAGDIRTACVPDLLFTDRSTICYQPAPLNSPAFEISRKLHPGTRCGYDGRRATLTA